MPAAKLLKFLFIFGLAVASFVACSDDDPEEMEEEDPDLVDELRMDFIDAQEENSLIVRFENDEENKPISIEGLTDGISVGLISISYTKVVNGYDIIGTDFGGETFSGRFDIGNAAQEFIFYISDSTSTLTGDLSGGVIANLGVCDNFDPVTSDCSDMSLDADFDRSNNGLNEIVVEDNGQETVRIADFNYGSAPTLLTTTLSRALLLTALSGGEATSVLIIAPYSEGDFLPDSFNLNVSGAPAVAVSVSNVIQDADSRLASFQAEVPGTFNSIYTVSYH